MTGDRCREWYERARKVMPGGVSSPVRAFRAVGGTPPFMARGEGPRLWDVGGREYIDYVLSWGPLILGHRHPKVRAAVERVLRKGTHYGMPTPEEVRLAEKIVELVPGVEMVRFVNSGTEATMSAARLARAVTGRELLVKFDGAYHGHADSFLVQAGSGLATLGIPASPGVPEAVTRATLSLPFNDLDTVEEVFRARHDDIAAVIVEPVMGNAGLILPEDGYLEGLRAITREYGSLLIFDEVMTGFRVALGGAQARYGVIPDLTTLGKVIGAGFPVGAYGGSVEIMSRIAPDGDVYQAGTLSGNPVAMAAGLAQLEELQGSDPFDAMEERGRRLVDGIVRAAERAGLACTGGVLGSMWCVYLREPPIRRYEDVQGVDRELFARVYRACLDGGVFLPPSPFEACFLSTEHGDAEIEGTVDIMGAALAKAVAAA